jgi:hypothetical protein
MILKVLSFLFLIAFSVPCHGRVEQFIRFDTTGTYSYIPGTADAFSDSAATIAKFLTHTEETFAACIAAKPEFNPLFISPPEILSIAVVDVTDSSPGEMKVKFQTEMRVFSESGLTEANLAEDIELDSYWFRNGILLSEYMSVLNTEIPDYFGGLSRLQIRVETPRTYSPTPTTSPPPQQVSTSPPVLPPTTVPVKPPTSAPTMLTDSRVTEPSSQAAEVPVSPTSTPARSPPTFNPTFPTSAPTLVPVSLTAAPVAPTAQ